MGNRMKPAIVLVDPLYGGNLGSVVRVMANFGLDDLRLVRPAPGIFEDPMLEPMARSQALHILRGARTFDHLAEALADIEISLGFTTRLGKRRRDGYDLKPAVEKLFEEDGQAATAAVFGSEDKGLSNADLEKCHWLVRIPTSDTLKSLNLSQAVMLFAYEMQTKRREGTASLRNGERKYATVTELESFYRHMEKVLERIGFFKEETPERMMNEVRRIYSRRLPDPRDISILRGILAKVEFTISDLEEELEGK